ncbi:hypothetical protein AA103196_0744 [Ameyamaea chiangmaiensis NBRC 103196]|uniref:tRNA uridine(34) hydroxylase n=1 Tax=Ameyamaea chiangmaiensis TaxID=442969 RepID=A0A850PBH1_9PROT|nr:rhodanese-related sulfurtransferase [Ameyamaea chiangmaiensis]MBS4075847.1 rhodanese-related sulfurtransferase [Ameyamaea chiangmaiensis]NVN39282.1 rhodanese-related sulfurtransferase [Ameyamaea chiangmaiensis]GBQ63963.1 hypothetical protein AA103196_0744 [Ameyamaea chiangmaiensis NBRC 103196]
MPPSSPIPACSEAPESNTADLPVRIAALYRFAPFNDCDGYRASLQAVCGAHGVRGILLVAPEGINGTIAGSDDAIEAVLGHIRTLPGCSTLEVKYARAAALPFLRMKVRIKREIVSMDAPGLDPAREGGILVEPEAWNTLISEPGTILIDTRNDYEVAIGSFAGAIDPHTQRFRDFPDWFRANRERLLSTPDTKIAMFCTGGIRCEKATAFLRAEGVGNVFHLHGGILNYFEKVPASESLWQGECFVFDQRVAVTHDLKPGTHTVCHACRAPLSHEDQKSPLYRPGESCPHCHAARTNEQRARYAERERQVQLARSRGATHLGQVGSDKDDID